MNTISISCPSCAYSRQMPADKVPEGTRRVTCPQCGEVFSFTKPATEPPASADEAPALPPTAPPQPEITHQARLGDAEGALPALPRPRPKPAPRKKLLDIGDLFTESWQLFQRRFAVLIGLYLLTIVAFILPLGITVGVAMLAGMARGGGAFVAIGVVGFLAGLYLGFRCMASFLHGVVDDQLGFGEALARGKGLVLPLVWIGFLSSFIIGGGFFLLVIPGIVFMVWFFFAQFILVDEEIHGMGALLKSREYVRGEWFNVGLRLLLVWAASLLIGMVPMAGPLLCLAFFPFMMIFHYLIYRDLREMKGDIPYSCGTVDILRWPAVALLGFVVVPMALVSFVGFSLFGKFSGFLPQGASVVLKGAPTMGSDGDRQGPREITFPQGDGSAMPETGADNAGVDSYPGTSSTTGEEPPSATPEVYPDNIHVFIYAVNYTGTVSANGTVIREMEGKPDMQYNYNTFGQGLRYGENQIDIDYAEIPNPPSTLLGVHVKISRNTPGKGKEILGEWRFSDRGTGRKTFTLDIPRE